MPINADVLLASGTVSEARATPTKEENITNTIANVINFFIIVLSFVLFKTSSDAS
jgi:D-alanyl-lipoteichoic acid acyltransferase DltB (MBOAT superfamily)